MKFTKLFSYMLVLSLFFTLSCQSMGPVQPNDDYYAGKRAGEIAAKQDALDYRCIDYPVALPHLMRRHIAGHLSSSKTPLPERYIKGFKWGYRTAFRDLTDTYCGGNDYSGLMIP